jgi:alpha-tubulin suppressor-like RCC1 family protein
MKKILTPLLLIALTLGLTSCNANDNHIDEPANFFSYDVGELQEIVPAQATSISVGRDHSMAITADGTLWGWGNNRSGQFGDGTIINHHAPIQIMKGVSAVSAGDAHTMVITDDGKLWGWGSIGGTSFRNSPVQLENTSGLIESPRGHIMDDVITVYASGHSIFAITADNILWEVEMRSPWELIPVEIMKNVVAVSAAGGTAFAITNDGILWGWGGNHMGQLGDGTIKNRKKPTRIMENVSSVSTSGEHTMAITNNGDLYVWGMNWAGELGDGVNGMGEGGTLIAGSHRRNPARIMSNVSAVSTGQNYTMAITTDGVLWGWGGGNDDTFPTSSMQRLGDGMAVSRNTPVQIMENVVSVSAGNNHTLAVTTDGQLWSWGSNSSGKLGTDSVSSNYTPTQVMEDVNAVSVGANHTMAITSDNVLWGWGSNRIGELGDGSRETRFTPVRITDNISAVSAGSEGTLAINSDGVLFQWGRVYRGNGSGAVSDGFEQIMSNVTAVSTNTSDGSRFPLIIRNDGTLWTFENSGEELKIADNVQTAAAGDWCSFFVDSNGVLWGYGSNINGQLGGGTANNDTDHNNPVRIMENVVAVSTGGNSPSYTGSHSMAITADGTLWGWSPNNQLGQLGISESDYSWESRTPTRIMSNVVAVSAGRNYTMAITSDGVLWGWGDNGEGQLGDGTTIDRHTPVRIMENVAAVSAGRSHTMAITTDGVLYAWGANEMGQLGIGKSTVADTPQRVMQNMRITTP